MLKQAQRGKFDVALTWAIDRLGRSLVDVLQTIESLRACNVDLYLDQQSIDTTTPAGELMLQMWEFERSMLKARIAAGLRRAVANGKKLGRPLNDPDAIERARGVLGDGLGINSRGRASWAQQRHYAEDQGGNGGIVTGPYTLSAYLDLSTIDRSELFYTDIEKHSAQGDDCRALYPTPPPPKAFAPVA
jgi:hypothetical protein